MSRRPRDLDDYLDLPDGAPRPARIAKGKRRVPGEMNKLEARYARHLERRRRSGEIVWWKFEPIGLRLAKRCTYNPDFLVMLADGELEVHETKGFMREDAHVKLKATAAMFPFRVLVARWKAGDWQIEEIEP